MSEKEKKNFIVYDLVSLPKYLTIDNLFNIMNNGKIVIWDSSNGGTEPKIVDSNEFSLYDSSSLTKEEFAEKFDNLKD